jgi:hypothetical protein
MTVALSESGDLSRNEGTDNIIIRIHLDSIPKSILTG